MMKRTASAATALAASCTPALAHVAPWSSPDPPPLPVQFLISIALMAVAGAVILWQGAALAREALARVRERRRFGAQRHPGVQHEAVRVVGAHREQPDALLLRHAVDEARRLGRALAHVDRSAGAVGRGRRGMVFPVQEDGDLAGQGVAQADAAGRHHGRVRGGRRVAPRATQEGAPSPRTSVE